MERDIADIIDRFTIAKLKAERIKESESKKEFNAFNNEISKIRDKCDICIEQFVKLLYSINAMIWDLEYDLRLGKLDGALSEVGRRAIEIREHNNLRVQVKNIINNLTKTGFQDVKKDHLSEN